MALPLEEEQKLAQEQVMPAEPMPQQIASPEMGVAPPAPVSPPVVESPTTLSAYKEAKSGLQMAAKAGVERAAEEFGYMTEAARQTDEFVKQQQQREEEKKKELDRLAAEKDNADASVKNWKEQDFWADKSMGQRIMAGISLALGAVGAGLQGPGAENQGLKTINDLIRRDVERQRNIYEQLKDTAQAKSLAYTRVADQLKDRDLASMQMYKMGLERTKQKLEAVSSKYAGKEAQAKAKSLIGELGLKIAEQDAEMQARMAKLAAEQQEAKQKMLGRSVPSLDQYAVSEKGAEELRKSSAAVADGTKGLNRLLEISSVSGKSFSPELKAEANTIARMLQGTLREEILGPGTVTEAERAMLDEIVRNPTKLMSLDATSKKALNVLKSRINSKFIERAASEGIPRQASQQWLSTLGQEEKGAPVKALASEQERE